MAIPPKAKAVGYLCHIYMKTIHIEICKSYKKGTWKIRIGDIQGSSEMYNFSMKEILKAIKDEMEKK